MAFLDDLAVHILKVIYTSNHIDIGVPVPSTAVVKKITQTSQTKSNFIRTRSLLIKTSLAQEAFEEEFQQPQELGAIYRPVTNDRDLRNITDDNYDTVAIAVHKDKLYIACNIKTRRNQNLGSLKKISDVKRQVYSGYNYVSPTTFQNIVNLLRLDAKRILRRRGVHQIAFVSPSVRPTTAQESAAPHAEMQLLSYLMFTLGASVRGKYFGVSKQCCGKCAAVLEAKGVRYDAEHYRAVANWKPHGAMQVRVLRESWL
jgi:hypothetical protein